MAALLPVNQTTVTTNAVFADVHIGAYIKPNKKLGVRVRLTLRGAETANLGEANETWAPSGKTSRPVFIPDLYEFVAKVMAGQAATLPADQQAMAPLLADIVAVNTGLVALIGKINEALELL